MFTRVRRQLIQHRYRRSVRGEFLAVVLFGYALPLVYLIGIIAAAYLGPAR